MDASVVNRFQLQIDPEHWDALSRSQSQGLSATIELSIQNSPDPIEVNIVRLLERPLVEIEFPGAMLEARCN